MKQYASDFYLSYEDSDKSFIIDYPHNISLTENYDSMIASKHLILNHKKLRSV